MPQRRFHLFRTFVALMAILLGFVAAAAWLVNRPETLRHALAVANLKSPWRIDVAHLRWKPLASELLLEGIAATNDAGGSSAEAKRLVVRYKPLGILRGKLVVSHIDVDGVRLRVPKREKPPELHRPRRLNLGKLLLFKNLEIQEATVRGGSITFGAGSVFAFDELRFSLVPSFFGDTRLSIRTDGLVLAKGERQIVSAANLSLKAGSDLSRWHAEFPYLNAVDGAVKIADSDVEGLLVESLAASVSLEDSLIKLSDLSAIIGGNALEGWLTSSFDDERFDIGIDIPKPILLPHFGRPMETMDLSGQISGRVRLEGRGLIPSQTSGQGRVEIVHRFTTRPDTPVTVATNVSWANGAIQFPKADVQVGSVSVAAAGFVDIPGKKFRIEATGREFLLEDLFSEFRNPYLTRIYGPTDFSGTIEGWGRTFLAKVKGTTRGGGWKPISADRIETELEATYDDLKLKGTIFSGERQTGKADFKIHFGPKIGTADRAKQLELDAEIVDHPVVESLGTSGVAGVGNGRLHLSGPHTAFKGEATARIDHGSLHGLPFDLAAAKLAITRRQVLFSELELAFPGLPVPAFTSTIAGDIGEGNFRLHGTPMAGLEIDTTYRYADGRWLVHDASWSDPDHAANRLAATGSLGASGGADLRVKGSLDLGATSVAEPFVREGSGPIDIDLAIRGPSADPRIVGSLVFHDNTLSPRGARLGLEQLRGAIRFEGNRIRFDGFESRIDDGDVRVSGTLDYRGLEITGSDLTISGHAMRYRSEDGGLSLELEGNLNVSGRFPSPLITGDVTVLDGKYTKDFTLIDAITGARRKAGASKEALPGFDPRLNLRARSAGDLEIRNNVGDIWLTFDVGVKGTRRHPVVAGAIETREGEVHYLGLDFDITRGFLEFRQQYQRPYMEVTAQKEVGVYNVTLLLHGPTDNLALDLSATSPAGPLEKRDVISLLMFGVTEKDRAASQQVGGALTTQAAVQSISGIIGGPIQSATGLDVFRLESSGSSSNVSRVAVGKRISDRLTVNFSTDINTTNAVQTVTGEYQITDNLLISGQRSSDANYRFGGLLRFRLR